MIRQFPLTRTDQRCGSPRYFQQLHDAHALPDMIGADPACLAGKIDLFKSFMPEAADHSFTVNVLVYSVNHRSRGRQARQQR